MAEAISPVYRSLLNAELARDPSLRICGHCGARARIDSQGRTVAERRDPGSTADA